MQQQQHLVTCVELGAADGSGAYVAPAGCRALAQPLLLKRLRDARLVEVRSADKKAARVALLRLEPASNAVSCPADALLFAQGSGVAFGLEPGARVLLEPVEEPSLPTWRCALLAVHDDDGNGAEGDGKDGEEGKQETEDREKEEENKEEEEEEEDEEEDENADALRAGRGGSSVLLRGAREDWAPPRRQLVAGALLGAPCPVQSRVLARCSDGRVRKATLRCIGDGEWGLVASSTLCLSVRDAFKTRHLLGEPRQAAEGASKRLSTWFGEAGSAIVRAVQQMLHGGETRPWLTRQLQVRSLLVTGAPGCGKSALLATLAEAFPECGAHWVSPMRLLAVARRGFGGDAEAALREMSVEAVALGPSLVLVDDLDDLCTDDDSDSIAAALCALLRSGAHVGGDSPAVLAVATAADAARLPRRVAAVFDLSVALQLPSLPERRLIAQDLFRDVRLARDVSDDPRALAHWSDACQGFSLADLTAAKARALASAASRASSGAAEVRAMDLEQARRSVTPSSLLHLEVVRPSGGFAGVGGLEGVKQRLIETIVWPLERRAALQRLGVRPARGVLLFGPPGTGKTLLARCVAAEARANLVSASIADLVHGGVGDSEKAVVELFAKARAAAPCVIFFDEFQAVFASRDSSASGPVGNRLVAQLQECMDAASRAAWEGREEPLIVLAATNAPAAIDRAFFRAGRFDQWLHVPLPNASERAQVLAVHAARLTLAADLSLPVVAAATEGFSGADLANLCRVAAVEAVRRDAACTTVTQRDFEAALALCRPSVSAASARAIAAFAPQPLASAPGSWQTWR
jgi:SpoVK/Ycf46/Vps4 family AAA+-type ATPase